MAKHPVPKQKTSKARSRSRYGSFKTKTLKKISNAIKLVTCSNCGAKRKMHHACLECGMYRGRQVLDKSKKVEKITKIKA
ncbi:MAG: 50S ribosomal protein L32 [Candidatus Gracilibacteria bacterium]|jgi:large subunit ribosomal protein L32|nr:50S ribosomal protein L32 [Candidatus Gracilibacteria bacterium]